MLKFLVGERANWLLVGMSLVCAIVAYVNGEPVEGWLVGMGGWVCAAIAERQLEIEKAAS